MVAATSPKSYSGRVPCRKMFSKSQVTSADTKQRYSGGVACRIMFLQSKMVSAKLHNTKWKEEEGRGRTRRRDEQQGSRGEIRRRRTRSRREEEAGGERRDDVEEEQEEEEEQEQDEEVQKEEEEDEEVAHVKTQLGHEPGHACHLLLHSNVNSLNGGKQKDIILKFQKSRIVSEGKQSGTNSK